ncbi:unnamed protein product [Bursaphelenchus xylophilus]|uniref:(pine wood nematode) hypothetical protein n=1 Tax=Bursaphelenchus xylophilus TaxID=6326 RepID=A0A811LXG8_BURXY|nr:unnamed protein product [Bursaphelenchus xylophilus]CAG9125863.1 unnamed protein product [Bursaphelenchus xylophilus]
MGAYVEVVQERTAQQRCDCIASGIELASIIAISVAVCVPWWFTDDAQVSFSLLGFTCKVEEYPCPVVIRVYTTLDDPFLKITFGLVASCIILEAISALVSHCVSCRPEADVLLVPVIYCLHPTQRNFRSLYNLIPYTPSLFG